MLKNNLKIATAIALATTIIWGNTASIAMADVVSSNENNTVISKSVKQKINDGIYKVKNKTAYIQPGNETGESMARNALNEVTEVEVKEGKTFLTLSFNKDLYQFMKNIRASVDGKQLEAVEDKENKSIKVEVPSIESKLLVEMNIVIMGRDVQFYMTNDMSTLETINEAPVIDVAEITTKVGESADILTNIKAMDKEDGELSVKILENNVPVKDNLFDKAGEYTIKFSAEDSNGLVTIKTVKVKVNEKEVIEENEKIKDGSYSIKNSVSYVGQGNASIGNDMARKALEEKSFLDVKNGETRVTLKFTAEQYQFIGDIKISVDGNEVLVERNDAERSVKFKVPSIDSEIVVSTFVTMMNREVSFKTTLLRDTLESITNGNDGNTDNNQGGNNNSGDTTTGDNNGQGNNGSNSNTNVTTPNKEVVKGKLYTIENKVTHESQTGVDMARKYLNKVSDIQEVNGKTYVTLTFTGVDFMKDYQIYVNGNKVTYTVVSKDSTGIKLKFEIPNLDAKIKVKTYVVPMSREVEFGVELLKDTLKFVKEYKVDELPKTGSPISGGLMAQMGTIMLGASALLSRRKK